MGLTMSEKIKVVLKRRGMTMGELAEKTGQTRQNLSNKMTRDNFPEKELRQIADFDFSSRPALAVQRDIFEFQCCVGCRIGDL